MQDNVPYHPPCANIQQTASPNFLERRCVSISNDLRIIAGKLLRLIVKKMPAHRELLPRDQACRLGTGNWLWGGNQFPWPVTVPCSITGLSVSAFVPALARESGSLLS